MEVGDGSVRLEWMESESGGTECEKNVMLDVLEG
jgi:hypothetical protein